MDPAFADVGNVHIGSSAAAAQGYPEPIFSSGLKNKHTLVPFLHQVKPSEQPPAIFWLTGCAPHSFALRTNQQR